MNETRQRRASLLAFLAVMLLTVGLVVTMIRPYLMAIIMGGILALLTQPLQRRLLARGLRPTVAAAIVTASVVLLVVGPLVTFSALAVKQAITLGHAVVAQSEEVSLQELYTRISEWGPVSALVDEPSEIEQYARQGLQALGKSATGFVLRMAAEIPQVFMQTALACMACFFLLVDGKPFLLWLGAKIPIDMEVRGRLTLSFRDTAISVVWASMAAAATQATLMLLAFLLLRVPAAFLAGGATFIFAWIPVVGSGPVWLAGAAYLYYQDAPVRAVIMAIVGIVTGLADNVVRPLVLGGRGEMHPLVSLVAIFGGLHLFGIFGVFVGPILAAVVITLLQVWPSVGRRAGLHFPDDEAAPATE